MIRKIVIIGPESTGKSTLSEQLAGHYRSSWAPEYARKYLETLGRPYVQEDLRVIAEGQLRMEQEALQNSNGRLVFFDTDLHVIRIWSEHKYRDCDPWILRQLALNPVDQYLLTQVDIPWQQDPQREHPEPAMRAYFYQLFRGVVVDSGLPWADIHGSCQQRFELAVQAVDALLVCSPQ